MPEAIFDFPAIARSANLRALEGRKQNEATAPAPVEMPCDVNPQDWYGYAGYYAAAERDEA